MKPARPVTRRCGADVVGTHAGARELHDVSRPARFIERSHAERAHADALSALPRGDQAPGDGARQRRDYDQQEQSHVRTVVRELPLERSWLESPLGPVLHALGRSICDGLSLRLCGSLTVAASVLALPVAAAAQAGTAAPSTRPGAADIADQASAVDQAAQPAATPEPVAEDTRSLFAPTWNMFQLSGRVSSISGDPARWQRYQDFGDGLLFTQGRVLHETPDWNGSFSADNVGWSDQRTRQLRTDRLPQNQRTLR